MTRRSASDRLQGVISERERRQPAFLTTPNAGLVVEWNLGATNWVGAVIRSAGGSFMQLQDWV